MGVYEVKQTLDLYEYLAIVQEIADEYINDVDGSYQPHIGRINTMRIFYNHCVTKCDFDEKYGHDVIDADNLEEIIADKNFVRTYTTALYGLNDDGSVKEGLTFANAYADALAIVSTKKNSLSQAFNHIKDVAMEFIDILSPLLTSENIETLRNVAKEVANGEITADAIIDAFGKKIQEKQAEQSLGSEDNTSDDTNVDVNE